MWRLAFVRSLLLLLAALMLGMALWQGGDVFRLVGHWWAGSLAPAAVSPAIGAAPSPNEIPVGPPIVPLTDPDLSADTRRDYQGTLDLIPYQAKHFALVDGALQLNDEETTQLARNGFVLSGRSQWQRFVEAYAWIYWQDLPVLVTTDSILQTVHQSYSDLLQDLEAAILIPQLHTLLTATQAQVTAAAGRNQARELDRLYRDVEHYLGVAIALLEGKEGQSAEEADWLALAQAADQIAEVKLFGSQYEVDFTLFQPRGHYTSSEELSRYFRAMAWLAHLDFRMVTMDPQTHQPTVYPQAIAAAAILRDALSAAQQRATWEAIDDLVEALVGPSDNMTLPDFDRFWADMALRDPASVLEMDPESLLRQLTTHDYGQQQVTGQLIARHVDNDSSSSTPRPVSFMLLGQRFALDAYILGNLVYDRVMVDGKPVERALPSPLDVMYALGDDRAVTHLAGELEKYPYAGYLAALRQRVDQLDPGFWEAPLYNQWLGMIRALNAPTLDARYPQAMRTAAWADKVLQTQLASWAQLRHDNLLYIKQSVTTVQVLCDYPTGYVEPYPAFYAALQAYAQAGHGALTNMDPAHLTAPAQAVRQRALDYFEGVIAVAERLHILAEKELRQEAFTPDEEAFLKSVIKHRSPVVPSARGCGGGGLPWEAVWDGWYMDLFYIRDDNPAVIADVHTNPNADPQSSLSPPRVLHAATGPVAALLLLVDTAEGSTLYVGPAFTYFEVTTTGDAARPPQRLDDEAWRARLTSDSYPQAPAWTLSFRPPVMAAPQVLVIQGPQELSDGQPTDPAADQVVPPASPLPTP